MNITCTSDKQGGIFHVARQVTEDAITVVSRRHLVTTLAVDLKHLSKVCVHVMANCKDSVVTVLVNRTKTPNAAHYGRIVEKKKTMHVPVSFHRPGTMCKQ